MLFPFFHSDGLYNWSRIEDQFIDSLLVSGATVSHEMAKRRPYYDQLYETIREQLLIIPVRDYVNLVVANKDIQDLRFSSQGWFPFLIDLRLER